jgi:hypothetical protein
MGDYDRSYAWALDFVRAYNERPFICKILARLIFGKYGYREFVGLVMSLQKSIFALDIGFSLEGCEYHKEKYSWIWWNIE